MTTTKPFIPLITASGEFSPPVFLKRVLGTSFIEATAAAAHDRGWKGPKNAALADPNNPFLGWGTARVRVRDVRGLSLDEISQRTGIATIPPEKLQAIASGSDNADVTHPLFRPWAALLREDPKRRLRDQGQNSIPMLVLVLHLLQQRSQEIQTLGSFRALLGALLSAEDPEGRAARSKIMGDNHIAFLAAQLVHGERAYPNPVPDSAAGTERVVPSRSDFEPLESLDEFTRNLDGTTIDAAIRWMLERTRELPTKVSERTDGTRYDAGFRFSSGYYCCIAGDGDRLKLEIYRMAGDYPDHYFPPHPTMLIDGESVEPENFRQERSRGDPSRDEYGYLSSEFGLGDGRPHRVDIVGPSGECVMLAS